MLTVGAFSHASPRPSPSESFWSALATVGQLSSSSATPSPSSSRTSTEETRKYGLNSPGGSHGLGNCTLLVQTSATTVSPPTAENQLWLLFPKLLSEAFVDPRIVSCPG